MKSSAGSILTTGNKEHLQWLNVCAQLELTELEQSTHSSPVD